MAKERCPFCGRKVGAGDERCRSCGFSLARKAAPAAVARPAAAAMPKKEVAAPKKRGSCFSCSIVVFLAILAFALAFAAGYFFRPMIIS